MFLLLYANDSINCEKILQKKVTFKNLITFTQNILSEYIYDSYLDSNVV